MAINDIHRKYDCAIVGGGIGGLCLAIQLARLGRKIILFEKYKYPFHKVCGEYISNESAGFLLRLGLPFDEWELPQISSLKISSNQGYILKSQLDLGGFGLSRYKLDSELATIAAKEGVTVLEDNRVSNVKKEQVTANGISYYAQVIIGAFGKSNPVFAHSKKCDHPKDNYIGVKYHIRMKQGVTGIELHNFRKGYCGISRVENNRYCLCYISHSKNLLQHENSIHKMEENLLCRNPLLRKIFSQAEMVLEKPVVVSNIRFTPRKTGDENMLYLGDAAGCISPLTGNGMSMAGYGSTILAALIEHHLSGSLDVKEMHTRYNMLWNEAFSARIRRGRQIQRMFGKPLLSGIALRVLNPMQSVKLKLVQSSHGVPF